MLDLTVVDYLRILAGVSWRVLLVVWVVSTVGVAVLVLYAMLRYAKPAAQGASTDE